MWFLYDLAIGLGLLLSAPLLLARKGWSRYGITLRARLAHHFPDPPRGRPLWIHAVSVGEVAVARTLIEALPRGLEIVLTTVTPTGQQRALATCGARAAVTYLPFDMRAPVDRFLTHFDPRGLVLIESELWPRLLRQTCQRNLPIVVINGRVSDRSYRRLRQLRRYLRPLLTPVNCFAMQSRQDSQRLLALGVPAEKVTTTGNLKYDSKPPERIEALETALEQLCQRRRLLVAGSTMEGEEARVLRAFSQLEQRERGLLLLAPRHPERWDAVAEQIESSGLRLLRRSTWTPDPPAPEKIDVLLLDSLGELASVYRLAACAFIGGTLVPTGGHNPIEAALFGCPVVVGPSMENFAEIAAQFDQARAWQRVADEEQLAAVWSRCLESEELESGELRPHAQKLWDSADPNSLASVGARGHALVAENSGALVRTVDVLAQWIQFDPAMEASS